MWWMEDANIHYRYVVPCVHHGAGSSNGVQMGLSGANSIKGANRDMRGADRGVMDVVVQVVITITMVLVKVWLNLKGV